MCSLWGPSCWGCAPAATAAGGGRQRRPLYASAACGKQAPAVHTGRPEPWPPQSTPPRQRATTGTPPPTPTLAVTVSPTLGTTECSPTRTTSRRGFCTAAGRREERCWGGLLPLQAAAARQGGGRKARLHAAQASGAHPLPGRGRRDEAAGADERGADKGVLDVGPGPRFVLSLRGGELQYVCSRRGLAQLQAERTCASACAPRVLVAPPASAAPPCRAISSRRSAGRPGLPVLHSARRAAASSRSLAPVAAPPFQAPERLGRSFYRKEGSNCV